MANQFLVEIHDYISRQIELGLTDRQAALDRADVERLCFLDGRLDELRLLRAYLSEHFDLATQKYY